MKESQNGRSGSDSRFLGGTQGIRHRTYRVQGQLAVCLAAGAVMPASALAGLREAAERQGRDDFTSMWCGQNVTGCREVPAGELLQSLRPRERV